MSRPVTVPFSGRPGSVSLCLHMGGRAFGPPLCRGCAPATPPYKTISHRPCAFFATCRLASMAAAAHLLRHQEPEWFQGRLAGQLLWLRSYNMFKKRAMYLHGLTRYGNRTRRSLFVTSRHSQTAGNRRPFRPASVQGRTAFRHLSGSLTHTPPTALRIHRDSCNKNSQMLLF